MRHGRAAGRFTRARPGFLVGLAVFCVGVALPARQGGELPARAPVAADLDPLDDYIRRGWAALTRTPRDLPTAAVDPKFPARRGHQVPVYVSRLESVPAVR